MTKKEREEERRKEEREKAIKKLKETVKEGDVIYGVLNYVSSSGLSRSVSLYVIKENKPIALDGWAADLLEGYDSKHGGCKVLGLGWTFSGRWFIDYLIYYSEMLISLKVSGFKGALK